MIKLFSFLAGKKRAAASSPPRSDRPTVAPSASSAQVKASSMPSQYDPQLAILLAGLCEQTYIQYGNGPPPANNGKITVPQGYTQVAFLHRSRDSRHRVVDAVFALASVEQRRLGTVTPRVRSFGRALPHSATSISGSRSPRRTTTSSRCAARAPSSSGPSTPRCRRFPCHSSGITTRNSSWRVFTSAFLCCLRCWRTRSSRPPRASMVFLAVPRDRPQPRRRAGGPDIADCRSAHRQ